LLLGLLGCVPLIDPAHRPCPCAAGYFCCTDVCLEEGATCDAPGPGDVVVNFEGLHDMDVLDGYGGITWGPHWKVWDGHGPAAEFSYNAFVDSTSMLEVTAPFTVPGTSRLKTLKVAVGSGGQAVVKLSSSGSGNAQVVVGNVSATYQVVHTGWLTAAGTVTVAVTCSTKDGASDVAFDELVYGP
jgi:hypothetical protein